MLRERNDTGHNDEAKGVWNVSLLRNERGNMDQLVSLPWRAVVLRHFGEDERTTPKKHAVKAIPYVRTELQFRFAWCGE